jgi:hypothetical protein
MIEKRHNGKYYWIHCRRINQRRSDLNDNWWTV